LAVVTASRAKGSDFAAHLQGRLATLADDRLPVDKAEAAVLILIRSSRRGLEVLSEQRAEQPSDPWSGQVGLPGGHTEASDRSLTDTVLRELEEEVGIHPHALAGPPRLFDVRRARPSGLRVAVFADQIRSLPDASPDLASDEVTTTFWLPLRALEKTQRRTRATPYGDIEVDAVEFESHVVWGFTLRVLQDFMGWLRAT
jgi:8-oxo-dGTP pyrophosphatase MutT (NUDIX family)